MATKFDKVRNEMMAKVSALFAEADFDVLQTGTNEICVPIIGDEAEEGYLVMTFKVPKGSRDGDAYDGYAMAEDFKMKTEAKAEKAKKAKEAKDKKIARDAEMRKQKAEAKAKREAEGK